MEGNSTDHNRWLYIVRITKAGRLIIHNTREICRILIMAEQYLIMQIVKGTACLEDIFTDIKFN